MTDYSSSYNDYQTHIETLYHFTGTVYDYDIYHFKLKFKDNNGSFLVYNFKYGGNIQFHNITKEQTLSFYAYPKDWVVVNEQWEWEH